jgi:hypothetical protein
MELFGLAVSVGAFSSAMLACGSGSNNGTGAGSGGPILNSAPPSAFNCDAGQVAVSVSNDAGVETTSCLAACANQQVYNSSFQCVTPSSSPKVQSFTVNSFGIQPSGSGAFQTGYPAEMQATVSVTGADPFEAPLQVWVKGHLVPPAKPTAPSVSNAPHPSWPAQPAQGANQPVDVALCTLGTFDVAHNGAGAATIVLPTTTIIVPAACAQAVQSFLENDAAYLYPGYTLSSATIELSFDPDGAVNWTSRPLIPGFETAWQNKTAFTDVVANPNYGGADGGSGDGGAPAYPNGPRDYFFDQASYLTQSLVAGPFANAFPATGDAGAAAGDAGATFNPAWTVPQLRSPIVASILGVTLNSSVISAGVLPGKGDVPLAATVTTAAYGSPLPATTGGFGSQFNAYGYVLPTDLTQVVSGGSTGFATLGYFGPAATPSPTGTPLTSFFQIDSRPTGNQSGASWVSFNPLRTLLFNDWYAVTGFTLYVCPPPAENPVAPSVSTCATTQFTVNRLYPPPPVPAPSPAPTVNGTTTQNGGDSNIGTTQSTTATTACKLGGTAAACTTTAAITANVTGIFNVSLASLGATGTGTAASTHKGTPSTSGQPDFQLFGNTIFNDVYDYATAPLGTIDFGDWLSDHLKDEFGSDTTNGAGKKDVTNSHGIVEEAFAYVYQWTPKPWCGVWGCLQPIVGVYAGLQIDGTLTFAGPTNTYPCTSGSANCFVLNPGGISNDTQSNAVTDCSNQGGFLAEPQNSTEESAALAALGSSSGAWIGGQYVAQYAYNPQGCPGVVAQGQIAAAACKGNVTGCSGVAGVNQQTYNLCTKTTTPTWEFTDGTVLGTDQSGTWVAATSNSYPFGQITSANPPVGSNGLVITKNGWVPTASSSVNPVLCEFHPGNQGFGLNVSLDLHPYLAAGGYAGVIWGSDDCGIGANVNLAVVNLGVDITGTFQNAWITLNSGASLHTGYTNLGISAPLSLFSGTVNATVYTFWEDYNYPIYAWDGASWTIPIYSATNTFASSN